jgi:hypothetical protein
MQEQDTGAGAAGLFLPSLIAAPFADF